MRPPRICFVGGVYHVTTRCNNKEHWFKDDSDFALFIAIMLTAKAKYGVYIYAYCLMHNHVHLLVGTPNEANLSKFMQYLNGNFAKAYNKKHGKTGHFWGGRFFSTIIESETQFFYTVLYIEANAVNAHLVSNPEDWKWSSYHAHAHGKKDPVVDFHELYLALGDTPEKRQQAFREMSEDRLKERGLRQEKAVTRGIILGSESFVQNILSLYGKNIEYYKNRKVHQYQGNIYSLTRTHNK